MKVQVLGPGCPKCNKTAENVKAAVQDLGLDAEVEKVDKIAEIMKFGIMITPAVAVDGDVKISGRVPSVEEIKTLLAGKGA